MSPRLRFALILAVFALAYFTPFDEPRVRSAILEAFALLGEYAREHVLLCLVPAFFIAGAITVFLTQDAVMRWLGATAPKPIAYGVAAVSGTVLAVCSCTVLPLFAGIHRRGAGLGPATTFLYSGPAINVLAIAMTARVLGWELGLARAVGAIGLALLIGITMGRLFRREEAARAAAADPFARPAAAGRPLAHSAGLLALLVAFLVIAALAKPEQDTGWLAAIWRAKLVLAAVLLLAIVTLAFRWFDRESRRAWLQESLGFAGLVVPLLFAGVLAAGLLLGRPGSDAGIIPARFVADLVGGNSLAANAFAASFGALMYFATLTEVPILQGLLGQGMGQGPALALLLAGPALSLPSMVVLHGVLGARKTIVYVVLVVGSSTLAGYAFGSWTASG